MDVLRVSLHILVLVSNDTQIVNVEPSKRLKIDELHQDKVTQTNVAKERKMVKIVTKYVEEGRQVEKIEELSIKGDVQG
jgi:hypothetical protein